MGDEIQGIMKRGTWEIFNGSQFLIKMCFQECGLSNARENLIGKSEKLKARCFVRGVDQKRLSTEPLNSYYPVVKWSTVRLMLIFQCILGFQSQSIESINSFAQSYIPSGEPVFVELPRYFKIDGGQHVVVLKLKKFLYGQAKAARLWYEKLKNGFLERSFVIIEVNP